MDVTMAIGIKNLRFFVCQENFQLPLASANGSEGWVLYRALALKELN
jgi:hypothetical protein